MWVTNGVISMAILLEIASSKCPILCTTYLDVLSNNGGWLLCNSCLLSHMVSKVVIFLLSNGIRFGSSKISFVYLSPLQSSKDHWWAFNTHKARHIFLSNIAVIIEIFYLLLLFYWSIFLNNLESIWFQRKKNQS